MWRAWFISIIVSVLSTHAFSVTISPLVLELNTDHRLTSQVIVTNNSTNSLALEANARHINFQKDGTIKTDDINSENVLIFPPAALLKPGEKQVFRIQWVSHTALETSESYFIRFSTVSLNQDSKKPQSNIATGINVKIHYNALFHVYDSSLQPDIDMQIAKQGKATLTNHGNRFTFTNALSFKDLDSTYIEALHEAMGEQFLPPHSSITFDSSAKNLPIGTYYGYEH